MSERICIEEPAKIASIVGLVDGGWFSLNDVQFNGELRTLTIPFRRAAERRIVGHLWVDNAPEAGREFLLVISHVVEYQVEETEYVAVYDLNGLKYDAAKKCIEIRGGIPLLIRIRVSRLEVCLEQTGRDRCTPGAVG